MTSATESVKSSKGRSLNNVKFLSVLSIFCALFLASVFIFDYFFSMNSQVAMINNTVSVVNDGTANAQIEKTVATNAKRLETQDDTAVNAVKIRSAMSESDFRQEAQNMVFRDSEESKIRSIEIQRENLNSQAVRMNAALSDESFRVEAKKILYREGD
ncbi:hypothetical protein [Psychrobacter sp. DAB_AL32B]|uniref:hypothetical protein n=1 Tax=Psychrobacter sp. DAB_AL32B TaxID=1028414 RepID=UPI000B7D5C7B|nr:hypothetical protein [Psychrobacter sp. DAB_AL32B]OXL24800.1 hypothetical protein CAN34_05100 [Psychrobacter sp. DAB_AL32B]